MNAVRFARRRRAKRAPLASDGGRLAGKVAWTAFIYALFIFLILGPLLTIVVFSFTPSVYGGVSPTTLEWYRRLFTTRELYLPLLRSFEIAIVVVAIQLVVGTLIAYGAVRGRVFGAGFLDAVSNVTLALPSVVAGIALLAFFGSYGPVQALAEVMTGGSVVLLWTFWIVVLAHVLETFPYMVRSTSAVLQKIDPHMEIAARSLGASRFTVFRTVVLPQLKPGLVAGSVLVFARSLAEFGATIIVVSAALRTAPIKIYTEAEGGSLELAAAYSVVLILTSFLLYVVMRTVVLRESRTLAA